MRKLFFFIALNVSGCMAQVLNEICPSNSTAHADFFAGYVDWIEIYNPTAATIHLEGYYLSDEYLNPTKWQFPALFLVGNSYLTLTADDDSELNTSVDFNFSRMGGTVYLFSPSGDIVDSIAYPELNTDHSYGRIGDKFYYFDSPSPGDDNNTETGFKGYANPPNVNFVSGGYGADLEVVLTALLPSETIYFSLNGSSPEDAFLYESPLILNQTTSLRTVAQADSMIQSQSVYRTFFINQQHQLPVVNIGVDSLALFDEEYGIFMMGPDAAEEPPHTGANFWRNQEVQVYYEYFNTDFELVDAMNCDIKTFGGIGSRWRAMKSIQLRGKKTYEQLKFSHQYFENKEIDEYRRLILRNGGNDFCNANMKDAALHNYFITHEIDVDFLAFNPVVVYINGNYWGIQNMREKQIVIILNQIMD